MLRVSKLSATAQTGCPPKQKVKSKERAIRPDPEDLTRLLPGVFALLTDCYLYIPFYPQSGSSAGQAECAGTIRMFKYRTDPHNLASISVHGFAPTE